MMPLINMLKRHEGVRDKVYICSAGYETIGVGRNISESGLGLSDDEIEYLLKNDIEGCRNELAVKDRKHQQRACEARDFVKQKEKEIGMTGPQ